MATIKIVCTHPMMQGGKRIEAGVELDVSPLEAYDAIAAGRARLVDPVDIVAAKLAAAEQRDRMLAAFNRSAQQSAAEWRLRRRA